MYYNLADVGKMESTLESLLPVIERLNALDKLIAYKFNLVGLCCRRDRYQLDESTKQLSCETLNLCKEHNNSKYLVRAMVGYGLINLWYGDFETAKQHLEEGLKFAEQAGDVINQIISLTYLAVTNRLQNNPDLCKAYARQSLDLCEREDEPTYAASAQANLGWIAWRKGDILRAKKLSLSALEGWSEYYPFKWLALWTLLDIHLRDGQLVKAIEFAQQIIDSCQQALPEDGENKLTNLVKAFEQGNTTKSQTILLETINWAKETNYL
jgi:tetratricopeptide (TPR) repeat protein